MTLSVDLLYGTQVDPGAWSRRHAAGEVPDGFPYGLDRLVQHDIELLAPRRSSSVSRLASVARAAVRKAGGGYDWAVGAAWRPGGAAVLSWSEQAGLPVCLGWGRSLPVVTGVIWATDGAVPRHVRPLVEAALRRARGVVVLSSAQVEPLVTELRVPRSHVHVVPFGVDADFFAPTGTAVDPDLVVSVGNDRHRDWSTAFEAFAEVRRSRPTTRLVVVSKTVPPALQARAAQDPSIQIIDHLGHRPLRELVASAAACLVLTRHNLHASGITAALEALSLGRPVVASDQPGMRDYAPRGSGMELVAPSDPEAAARALEALLDDPARADDVGAAGRRSVQERFSTHQQAAVLADVMRSAAG